MTLNEIVKSHSNTTKIMLPSNKQKKVSSTNQEFQHTVIR